MTHRWREVNVRVIKTERINSRIAKLLIIVALSSAAPMSSYALGWGVVKAKIRREFPAVKQITTAELGAWLNDRARPTPLLLDVRTRAEFALSHLKNAENVEPDAAASVVREAKDRPIVTYCSVGYRSAGFAERLRAAEYSNVSNLEGSIFQWANEGRPVHRAGAEVELVHPYNRIWGMLLQKTRRAEVPSVEAKR